MALLVEHSETKRLSPSTIGAQRQNLRDHIVLVVGPETPIDQIGTPHFDQVHRAFAVRRHAPKTMNIVLGIFSRAVRFYYERQGLAVPHFDVCTVKVPRSPLRRGSPTSTRRS